MGNRKGGFTLIELILSMAIMSILVLCIYSILNFTTNACKIGEEKDEIMLNGQYAIEYIKEEIREAEKIISIDYFSDLKRDYEDNIGFVIMRYFPKSPEKYNYSTYYLKNNRIYRLARNTNLDSFPKASSFSGHNLLAENVESIEETSINYENNTIDLNFLLKGEFGEIKEFKTSIFVRCPIMH